MPLPLPASRDALLAIQRARKRVAVEQARRSPLLAPRVADINLDRLDDPDEWLKIPPLSKDELRALSSQDFYSTFCIRPPSDAVEFWRSGGTTGRPLFYPRTSEDLKYCKLGFRRIWECIGVTSSDVVHDSFPLGIHPIGQMIARTAEEIGAGVVWAGAGTTTPSALQLELIDTLEPTVWAGMSSYALHLANVAEAQGMDLASASVRTVVCSAEQLTAAKREKLQRAWGARVYDTFGMTEGSMMASERDGVDGMRLWADLFLVEVVDEVTGKPVAEGQPGALVMTPLWNHAATPFLRWLSGDIVTLRWPEADPDPFSVFPILKHAHRTSGFFKIRGVNVNHTELEDFMFRQPGVLDFRAELVTRDDREVLRLLIEIVRGTDASAAAAGVSVAIKNVFEVTPDVEVLALGTLAREFEASAKAPRFVDRRQ